MGAVCRDASKLLSHLIGVTVMQIWEITDEPLYVLADSTQLQQVLMNLVANARDARPGRWTRASNPYESGHRRPKHSVRSPVRITATTPK